MLKKAVTQKKPDTTLPSLLFAYQAVHQASTGFSLFKLIRGPLDVHNKTWETGKCDSESVVSYMYVLAVQEKLAVWPRWRWRICLEHNRSRRSGMTEMLGKENSKLESWY